MLINALKTYKLFNALLIIYIVNISRIKRELESEVENKEDKLLESVGMHYWEDVIK